MGTLALTRKCWSLRNNGGVKRVRPLEGLGACFPLSSLLQTSRHNSPRPSRLPRLGCVFLHSQSWKQQKMKKTKNAKTKRKPSSLRFSCSNLDKQQCPTVQTTQHLTRWGATSLKIQVTNLLHNTLLMSCFCGDILCQTDRKISSKRCAVSRQPRNWWVVSDGTVVCLGTMAVVEEVQGCGLFCCRCFFEIFKYAYWIEIYMTL